MPCRGAPAAWSALNEDRRRALRCIGVKPCLGHRQLDGGRWGVGRDGGRFGWRGGGGGRGGAGGLLPGQERPSSSMVLISGAGNTTVGVLVHPDLDQALELRSCQATGEPS